MRFSAVAALFFALVRAAPTPGNPNQAVSQAMMQATAQAIAMQQAAAMNTARLQALQQAAQLARAHGQLGTPSIG
jgi:hypothetical protein